MKIFTLLTTGIGLVVVVVCIGNRLLEAKTEPAAPPTTTNNPTTKPAKNAQKKPAKQNQFAHDLLTKTRETYNQLRTFRANLKQTVNINGRSFSASGVYYKGRKNKLRLQLEMKFHLGTQVKKGALLQVCDGKKMHTLKTIGKQQKLTRRNVSEILNRAASFRDPAIHAKRISELGLGGISGMLASLEQAMIFDVHKTIKSNGTSIHIIEGTWKPQYTHQWHAKKQPIPPYIPDRIRVYVDANFILRQIDYLKKNPEKKSFKSMLTLKFEKFQLNVNFTGKEFEFKAPPQVFVEDITNRYLNKMATPR